MKYTRYQKRDAIRDYFPLPNEIFCLNLSSGEIAVYAYLLYREDRKTFQCHPSFRSIGNALNLSRNTVSKYIKSLEAKQLIRTEPTTVTLKSGKRQNGNLLYTILPIEQAVMQYYAQQLEQAKPIKRQRKAG